MQVYYLLKIISGYNSSIVVPMHSKMKTLCLCLWFNIYLFNIRGIDILQNLKKVYVIIYIRIMKCVLFNNKLKILIYY